MSLESSRFLCSVPRRFKLITNYKALKSTWRVDWLVTGKVAWSKKIEDEQLGGQIEAERGSRQAQPQTQQGYLPTFFTSQDNLSQLEATRRAAR